MFGVAIDIKLDDFKIVLTNYKPVIAGIVSQWIWLPLMTLGLIWLIKPAPSIALGMALVASCPGGNVSNFAVHLSKANTALSILLTMISTLFCSITTPLIFINLNKFLPIELVDRTLFDISFLSMFETIVTLLFIPLVLGLLTKKYFPTFIAKIVKPVRFLSIGIFITFIIGAVYGNFDSLRAYIGIVFWIVLLHNGLSLLLGYTWARYFVKLKKNDSRTISIETGIQNSGLGLILIFNFFGGSGGMALIAAWWGIWHLISAFVLAMWWRKKTIV